MNFHSPKQNGRLETARKYLDTLMNSNSPKEKRNIRKRWENIWTQFGVFILPNETKHYKSWKTPVNCISLIRNETLERYGEYFDTVMNIHSSKQKEALE